MKKNHAKYPDGRIRRYLYDHNNKPFTTGHKMPQGVEINVQDTRDRVRGNKASMVIVDGQVGEGKTTWAVHFADAYQGKHIDLRCQLGLGGEQFQERMQMCIDSRLPVVIYDEAGDFNKRGALTQFNARLNRLFETYRTFKILVILVLPNFSVLDNSLFDKGIPRMLWHCQDRNDNCGTFKMYSLAGMYYIREKMKKCTIPMHAYGQVQPNLYGHYLDLAPERSALLDRISTDGKKEVLSLNVIKNRGWVSYADIAKELGRTPKWVSQQANKLRIKPAKTHKRIRYFDPHVVERLRGAMG